MISRPTPPAFNGLESQCVILRFISHYKKRDYCEVPFTSDAYTYQLVLWTAKR